MNSQKEGLLDQQPMTTIYATGMTNQLPYPLRPPEQCTFERNGITITRVTPASTEAKASQLQIGGEHYRKLKIQPVQYSHANSLPFIEGSIVKYITRWREKGGIQDLRKIQHFVDLLIELEEAKSES